MFDIKEELKRVPEKPGVYIMHAADDTVIYVGKAVILKRRLSSYFMKTGHSVRIEKMISLIDHFEYIVVDSEYEALVLECNLIKKYRPKYNVLLKDDKTFPYIKVDIKNSFPKAVLARRAIKDGSKYFGPYCSADVIYSTLDALRTVFPLRSCNKSIAPDKNKRPCLNYYIGLCCAPCAGKVTESEYMNYVNGVCDFLSGKQSELKKKIEERMLKASEELNFELAAKERDKLSALERISSEQKVENAKTNNSDVISVAKNEENACVQLFFIRGGKTIGREFFILEGAGIEEETEILSSFISQFYKEETVTPKLIYTEPELEGNDAENLGKMLGTSIHHAQRGEMRKIQMMVKNNANIMLLNFESKGRNIKVKDLNILEKLRVALDLNFLPKRIEAYDISNLGDREIDASMVVFTDGRSDKSQYRHFKMKEITTRNDVGAMKETLTRRLNEYKAGSENFKEKPDIILVDGGLGQIEAARQAMAETDVQIPVFGMVKDNHHKTRALVDEEREILLKNHPELWHFISSIQDETHRFAIEYNRKLTEKRYKKSILDDVPGVGKSRKTALLRHFKTFKAIREATVEELAAAPSMNKPAAEALYNSIREKK